jgi:homoserine O-acetyltransferase
MLYQYDCSSDYNPAPNLEKIKARLIAINSADDEVNPPELGILEREIKRVKNGRYVLIPPARRRAATGRIRSRSCGSSIWWNCLRLQIRIVVRQEHREI